MKACKVSVVCAPAMPAQNIVHKTQSRSSSSVGCGILHRGQCAEQNTPAELRCSQRSSCPIAGFRFIPHCRQEPVPRKVRTHSSTNLLFEQRLDLGAGEKRGVFTIYLLASHNEILCPKALLHDLRVSPNASPCENPKEYPENTSRRTRKVMCSQG